MSTCDSARVARELRDQAARLRRTADEIQREAERIEAHFWGPNPLRGREIAEVAYRALAGELLAGRGPLHYTQLLDIVQGQTGRRVNGRDPSATLLVNLDRDDRIRAVGSRSGLYELAAPSDAHAVESAAPSAPHRESSS